ncbi:MAG: hypothetical protein NPIRA02_04980 [Nitrospirales bacterium]|nr:MAG: hypothetical protein NPIRA02_04980 [Nitrospirales bacterium]
MSRTWYGTNADRFVGFLDMPSPSDSVSTAPEGKASASESEALTQLRNLLFAPEQTKIEQLQNRLDDPVLQAKDVSRVLPDAILLRSKQDAQLASSLSPILTEVFILSIKKSPRLIVDAISPIMAPAIRKAIFSALQGMVQSLNQTLDHSVSWKGLQWRVESLRTGKPFAEIVLLHTLKFRVEQVFLIHRETGLLLQHVAADVGAIQDEAVVSGMLTAIQDFVHDSFGGTHADSLESLRVGELTVWIEQGAKAVLAGVVRGTPPHELREVFQQVLESIHVTFSESFEAFTGSQEPFEKTRPQLEACLQAQFEGESSKPSPFLWGMLIFICMGVLFWGGWSYIDHQRWTTFRHLIEKEAGIHVTAIDKEQGTTIVSGLRDPLSAEPAVLAEQAGLDPESIQLAFEPYFALSPHFLEARVRAQLQPPDSVTLTVEGSTLRISGKAPHQWIQQLENRQLLVPGLTTVATEHLIDTDMVQFETLRDELEQRYFVFAKGRSALSKTHQSDLVDIAKTLQELDVLAERLGQRVRVEIQGQSSREGSRLRNKQLRLARSQAVWTALSLHELSRTEVVPVEVTRVGSDEVYNDPALARRVSIKVFLDTE